jgi:hypothetical protein
LVLKDGNVSLYSIRLASGRPSEGGDAIRELAELPLGNVLFALPFLLAIAVLSAALLAPLGNDPTQPSHAAETLEAVVPQWVTPTRADEPAGTPTCSGCGQAVVARRNWETHEWGYDCKSPSCQ